VEDLRGALAATDERVGRTNTRIDDLERLIASLKSDRGMTPQALYDAQIARELDHYNEVADVHALPAIYDYWVAKHLQDMFVEYGITSIDEFYAEHLYRAALRVGGPVRFVSVGAGNCDTEARVAKLICDRGLKNFTLECLELNPSMLARGREHAAAGGVAEHIVFTQTDFNAWKPSGIYAGVMANQSLHHVTNLEGLFDGIKASLHPLGYFVTSDMIGRNGHQRWPEALAARRVDLGRTSRRAALQPIAQAP
jgi:SAM-dependent methyltransferase